MRLAAAFHEAFINLLSAKVRSFLAILGILVGTGSVVALISSSQLATSHALAQFKTLGTNIISLYLSDGMTSSSTKKSNQVEKFELKYLPILQKSSPQIVLIAPYSTGYQQMYFEGKSLQGSIIGATENFASIAKAEMKEGRFVSYLDEGNFYCDIGDTIASQIKATGENAMGNQIQVGAEVFTIIGILKKWPQNLFISADLNSSVIVPVRASFLLDKNTHVDNILIRLIQKPNIPLVKTQVTEVMHKLMPQKTVNFNSPEQLITLLAKSRQTYNLLLIAIGSISLVVGGIGVMNIMLVSVIERRREIGIRMAIGARQADILRMFLVEAVMLTLFGGFLGVVFGVFTSYILSVFSHWEFHLYLMPVILGFAVSVLVGVLSGFYPALRASRLNPIQCLNAE